jgi:hypothetical protein
MPERQIVKLERLAVHGPGRDRWFRRPGRVRGKWLWFDPGQVPVVEATTAWFEIERAPGGWRILRHVDDRP